ncbi:MAG: phosphodiesterase [bacterium]|nr:phosphodiesterase [bacterium]
MAGLTPETTYQLQLEDEKGRVGSPWPLKTFPAPESMPESFRLLAFTCAGGPDGFGLPGRQFFKPHEFRQRLFDDALKEKPDAAVAIGDQIYWDLRGGKMPPVGRNSALIKLVAGWYLKLFYGAFDRGSPLIGTKNEAVLTRIGDEQIADLYGTRFRSVPMLFISDDHDYFENDDAEEEIVTFPPDAFSRAAYKAMADLYYPPLPDGPSAETDRSFGTLRYGKLFEAPIFDCAGHLSLEGEDAGLVPPTVERWLLDRVKASEAHHFALIPSHPLGWTAGKWREWYPDVLAPDGYTGVVARGLMDDGGTGRLTSKAQKFLWPKGWWNQHQRLLGALVRRPSSRFIFSGDIHAQGAIKILESGKDDFSDAPVCSVLVGPVSTSDATWPSAARGIAATEPDWLTTSEIAPTREVNGFTILDFSKDAATARLFDCGGFDRNLKEDGHVQSVQEFEIG